MDFMSVVIEAKGGRLGFEELAIAQSAAFKILNEGHSQSVSRFHYRNVTQGRIVRHAPGTFGTFRGNVFTVEMPNAKYENCSLQFLVPYGVEELHAAEDSEIEVISHADIEGGEIRKVRSEEVSVRSRDVEVSKAKLN